MKIKYFQETDTLYIELNPTTVADTRDLDENTVLDVDQDGRICGLTIEHASALIFLPPPLSMFLPDR